MSLYIIYIYYLFCYFDILLLRHSLLAFSYLKRGEKNKTLFIMPTISYVSLTNPLLGSSCRHLVSEVVGIDIWFRGSHKSNIWYQKLSQVSGE